MAEQPAPEDQAEKKRQESFWASFTRADMKLFLVTFAGTVAANLVTLIVVAIAIISVRSRNGVRATPGTVFWYLLEAAFLTSVIASVLDWLRRKRRGHAVSRTIAAIVLAFVVALGLSTLILLLILLGYAVGVK